MSLNPGKELKLIYYAGLSLEKADLSDLVALTREELKTREQESVTKEEEVYGEIENLISEWERQASETIRLRKTLEYLGVPAVRHTSNQWVKGDYDWYEMSNMVYKMTCRVSESTNWRSPQRPRPIYWELTWSLVFNTPQNPDYSGHGRQIAGQRQKRFDDKAALEKYLRGRIKAYAHLFTELSPPIPKEHCRRFCVNGLLLPGYAVDSPEVIAPDESAVEELLGFLNDGDLPGDSQETQIAQQPETSPEEIWSRHRKQRQETVQNKQAPTR